MHAGSRRSLVFSMVMGRTCLEVLLRLSRSCSEFFYIGVDGHGNSDGCMRTPSQNSLNPETRAREALLEAGDSGSSIPERQNAKPYRGLKTNLEQLIN